MAIVPCFNEQGRVGNTIEKLILFVDRVVVVDDGSTDNSVEEIKQYDVELITYRINRGKGFAIRQGIDYFLKSGYDNVIFMDADGQHGPENIPKFRYKFENSDTEVLVASRFGTREWVENMPFMRKISNLLSRFGIWILYNGFMVEDPQNGFRAYRRVVLENIEFTCDNYAAETEIIIDAYLKGFKFDKIYIQSIYNEEENHSKFSMFLDTWTIPGIMVKGFFKFKPFLYRNLERKLKYRQLRKMSK